MMPVMQLEEVRKLALNSVMEDADRIVKEGLKSGGRYFYCLAAYRRDPQIHLRFHDRGDTGFEHVVRFKDLFKKHGLKYSLEDAQALAPGIERANRCSGGHQS
jgi:hypothetical protein